MNLTRKIFVFASIENLAKGVDIKNSLTVSDYDYRQFESLKGSYLFVCEREISFAVPEDFTGQAADAMAEQLSVLRAKHHAEQQKIIDSIAKLRQLAAPVEGELLDDSGLTARAKVIDDTDAEEADVKDLDIPF